jgi:hypothetical protein
VLAATNGPVIAVASLVGLVLFVLWLWALVDVLRRPAYAFEAAGVSRGLWVTLLLVSLLCGLAGFVGLVYVFFVRPRLRNQQQLGRGPGFPSYP